MRPPVLSDRLANPAAEPRTILHSPEALPTPPSQIRVSLLASFLSPLSGAWHPSPSRVSGLKLGSDLHPFSSYFQEYWWIAWQNNHQVLSILPSKILWRCSPTLLPTTASSVQVLVIPPWDCCICVYCLAASGCPFPVQTSSVLSHAHCKK